MWPDPDDGLELLVRRDSGYVSRSLRPSPTTWEGRWLRAVAPWTEFARPMSVATAAGRRSRPRSTRQDLQCEDPAFVRHVPRRRPGGRNLAP